MASSQVCHILVNSNSFLAVTFPAKIKRGGHVSVLTGIFSVYNSAQGNQLRKATGKY